jgi:hypothetical protein
MYVFIFVETIGVVVLIRKIITIYVNYYKQYKKTYPCNLLYYCIMIIIITTAVD